MRFCWWSHAWGPWRDGTATRRRNGSTAPAEGRECRRCGAIEFRLKRTP